MIFNFNFFEFNFGPKIKPNSLFEIFYEFFNSIPHADIDKL